jgi:import inner membrane translocase subunit TIM23
MAGVSILSQQDVDALGTQIFGLDPVVVLGLATAGFGAVGWLMGPVFGNAAFRLANKRFAAQMAAVSLTCEGV